MVLPFFIAMAVVEINQFVDTFWVSGLGSNSAEAVSTVIPIYGLMTCAGLGIGVGATTTIAFRLGRGEHKDASRLVANSLILGLIIATVSSILVTLLLDTVIDLMGAGNVRDKGAAYMIPYILLSPAIIISSIISGTLRGEGAARKSTIIQISAACMNMVLDPILIYGIGMGVTGAGLATALSALISVVIALEWYIHGKTMIPLCRSDIRIDREAMKEVLGVGGPKTIQSIISNVTDLIQRVFLIVAGGTTAIMLYNYTWRYIGVVNLPGRAFESAMVPVCSAAYGQADFKKMKNGYAYTIKLAIGFSIIFSIVLFLFAEPLMSLLTYEESMHRLLPDFVWTLRVSAFLIPFSAMMGLGSSMLQALKKAKKSMNFYMIWGFIKLGLYALSAYGFLGVDPFEGIIYCMVAVHIFGGIALMHTAEKEYRKVRAETTGPVVSA
ncbi:MAG: MATE family efflux transporter [Candidatus Methanomethylophilaceae archaeon]